MGRWRSCSGSGTLGLVSLGGGCARLCDDQGMRGDGLSMYVCRLAGRTENAVEGECQRGGAAGGAAAAAGGVGPEDAAVREGGRIMVSEPSAGVAAIYLNHFLFWAPARRNAVQPRGVLPVCVWVVCGGGASCVWWRQVDGWHG